jgi:hypothetical protein
MQRQTTITRTNSQSWTAPAGVTRIVVIPQGFTSNADAAAIPPTILTVVPNTSYLVTISTSWPSSVASLNTLGGIYSWTGGSSSGGAKLSITWVE